ncbi:MAG: hypothetical protein WCI05_14230 [Myxococcales bacterium]|jgi:hypothetical protein
MHVIRLLFFSLTAALFLLCGCDGESPQAPPSGLNYATPTAIYTKGGVSMVNSPTSRRMERAGHIKRGTGGVEDNAVVGIHEDLYDLLLDGVGVEMS